MNDNEPDAAGRQLLHLLRHCKVGAGTDFRALGDAFPEAKGIGIYSCRARAEAAIARVCDQPGFCDWPHGFAILNYRLDEDAYPAGFAAGGDGR